MSGTPEQQDEQQDAQQDAQQTMTIIGQTTTPMASELASELGSRRLGEYFRCREFSTVRARDLESPTGYFRFGPKAICYGQAAGNTETSVEGELFDASDHVRYEDDVLLLAFDADRATDNLRYERYVESAGQQWVEASWTKRLYYGLRPALPVAVRRHLQKTYLRLRSRAPFPSWPVDRSVDATFEGLLLGAMKASGVSRLPFIWFWPDGHDACATVTHDVETRVGRDFCPRLIDVNDEFGVKGAFQVVPEKRYPVPEEWLEMIRERGSEINVHGLDHEGNLFEDWTTFVEAARKINHYAELFGARGFRSPALYRNVDWFGELKFSYDMSFPNGAWLEAQRGGCCTVMPYFLPDGTLELPLTTTEDYTLFHILGDYSTTLWKRQMQIILESHGLITVLVHPDYIRSSRPMNTYRSLLAEIARLRDDHGVWVTLPGDVDRWWRQRSRMELVPTGDSWSIAGPGSERASIAYACADGDALVYERG